MSTLSSALLILRPLTVDDVNNVHQLHLLPQTDKYNTLGIPESIHQTEMLMQEWFQLIKQKEKYIFCIEDKEQNFAGLIGMNIGKARYQKAEIWYKINYNQWGKGFATEAVKMILSFGFNDLKLHRIEAGCVTENTASVKVLEKCGFIKEGIRRKNLPIRGEWKDNYEFAILEEEYGV